MPGVVNAPPLTQRLLDGREGEILRCPIGVTQAVLAVELTAIGQVEREPFNGHAALLRSVRRADGADARGTVPAEQSYALDGTLLLTARRLIGTLGASRGITIREAQLFLASFVGS